MVLNKLAAEKLKVMLETLKNMKFKNFLKKECQKDNIFTVQNNIVTTQLNQKFMYNDSQKKSMIYQMVLILLVADNMTTNLDIKNALHNVFPGIALLQSEVSLLMMELTNEKTDWTRKNNGQHYEYYFNQTTSTAHSDLKSNVVVVPDVSVLPDIVVDVAIKPTKVDHTNIMALVKQSDGKTVSLGKIGSHSADFLKKLDPHVKVAFAANMDPCLTNTTDKYDARKLFKQITGAKHNSVRTVSIKTYLKRKGIV